MLAQQEPPWVPGSAQGESALFFGHLVGELVRRAWREGPASLYQYITEVFDTDLTGEDEYIATGRLDGNFPGGTAKLKWRFSLAADRIRRLHIAP